MPESVLEAEGRKRARSCQEQTKVNKSHRISEVTGIRRRWGDPGSNEWHPPQASKTDHLLH